MTEPQQTQSVVVLDPSQVSAAYELAAAHGVLLEEVPHRGIEPVTTATLVLLGTATAVGAVQHGLEQRKGGQVIDLRPGVPKAFYRTSDLVYGMVVIIMIDGRVTVEVKEPDGMFGKVISALPKILTGVGGTKQVAQEITKTFGADVQIETGDSPASGGGV
jgi:hypothetical protein